MGFDTGVTGVDITIVFEVIAVVLACFFLLRVINLLLLLRWYRKPLSPGTTVDVEGRQVYYTIKGEGRPVVVIEPAMGACAPEWWAIQDELSASTRVLTYDRAGYGWSASSDAPRLSLNIAEELKDILDRLSISDRIVLVGHSIGGLFVNQFARLYPDTIAGVVLIDPAPPDYQRFKKELDPALLHRSGIDRTRMLRLLSFLSGFGFTRLMKKWIMRPYHEGEQHLIPAEVEAVLWHHALLPHAPRTALAEHLMNLGGGTRFDLKLPEGFPDVPLRVVTHSSEIEVERMIEAGRIDRSGAEAIETLWQEMIRSHVSLSSQSRLIVAEGSSHDIHLEQPGLVVKTVLELVNDVRQSGMKHP
ncbi:MAG TPA: alpha/beta hydrolase [Bacteroidota bacterium]|nr:alpha/beta hydrolase [Bacteroidota bacterium]